MTLARLQKRVLLCVYELWKSIWLRVEMLPPESPVDSYLESRPLQSEPFDPALSALPAAPPLHCRVHEQLRPIDRGNCVDSPGRCSGMFFSIQSISVWKWWKRFSSGNKTMSILVNVKRPLCPYWYFTSEPFLQTQPSVQCYDINKDEHHVSISCSCAAISKAQPSTLTSNLLLKASNNDLSSNWSEINLKTDINRMRMMNLKKHII